MVSAENGPLGSALNADQGGLPTKGLVAFHPARFKSLRSHAKA